MVDKERRRRVGARGRGRGLTIVRNEVPVVV